MHVDLIILMCLLWSPLQRKTQNSSLWLKKRLCSPHVFNPFQQTVFKFNFHDTDKLQNTNVKAYFPCKPANKRAIFTFLPLKRNFVMTCLNIVEVCKITTRKEFSCVLDFFALQMILTWTDNHRNTHPHWHTVEGTSAEKKEVTQEEKAVWQGGVKHSACQKNR